MAVVIDTGALIKGINLRSIGEEFITIPQVIGEVRDRHARKQLGLRLEQIITMVPREEDVVFVQDFARKIGELSSLSNVDVQVIALAVRLQRERFQGVGLNQEPLNTQPNQEPNDPSEDNSQTNDSTQQQFSDSDDEGWITPSNYKQPEVNRISVLTLDFAMQNTIMQIGLKLISVNGYQIRNIRRYVKKCQACLKICQDTEKEFCPECGNHTLFKLSYTINPDGSVKYYYSKNFRPNLRGTIFPIPKFKGGKAKQDMILREDELMMGGRQHKWNWGKEKEALDPQTLEQFGIRVDRQNPWKYGPKKRNPNEAVKRVNKKKKR